MKNNNFYHQSLANIYAKPNLKSEVTSQILYGEKFKILARRKNWFKMKTSYDNYIGFLKLQKFYTKFKPSLKVNKLKTKIYKKIENRFHISGKFLYFGSKILPKSSNKKFVEFEKNKWVKKSDLKPIDYFEKDFSKILKLFLNSKYLWGGKTSDGIDFSALFQIYFFFNNLYFPRDTKDQIKFIKKTKKKQIYNKSKLLYLKGHVAICLNKFFLIHAYGPRKKVVIMKKNETIKEIKENAKLNLIST